MLASRWIKHDHDTRASDESRRGFYRHIDSAYTAMLKFSMAHRFVIVGVCAMVIASLLTLFRASGINFTPNEDESRFQVSVRLPVGSSLAATTSLMERIARDMREQLPGVSDTLSFPGGGGGGFGQTNAGSLFVRLKPIDERELSQQELIVRARKLIQPYRQSAVISIQSAGGLVAISGRGAQIQYALVGPDLQKLDQYTERARQLLSKNETLVDVDRTYLPGRPELRLNIDRRRAGDLGVRVQDV